MQRPCNDRATSSTAARPGVETWSRLELGSLAHINPRDRKLIWHWCTSTYRTISYHGLADQVWGVIIPRAALHHPPLLHGLLALSALQLALTGNRADRQHYLDIAQSHKTATTLNGGLGRPGHSIVFAQSVIMAILSFAPPHIMKPDASVLASLIQVFESARSSADVTEDIVLGLKASQPGLLIYDDWRLGMPDTSRLAIQSLRRLSAALSSKLSQCEKDTYEATIHYLSLSLEAFMSGGDAIVAASIWIYGTPAHFLDMVKEYQPLALVILAHFTVITHSVRGQWWMGDWSSQVLQEIVRNLDDGWQPSVMWVMDAVG